MGRAGRSWVVDVPLVGGADRVLPLGQLVGGFVVDEVVGVCSCQVQGRCTGGSSGWLARIAAVTGDAVAGEVARTDANQDQDHEEHELEGSGGRAAKLLW